MIHISEGFSNETRLSHPPRNACPLQRAVQTAQAIGQKVTVIQGLREIYAGEWDGLTFEEIRERYPRLYAARADNLTIPIPGAEETSMSLPRFCAAMTQAAETAPGDFAVVAHGGISPSFFKKSVEPGLSRTIQSTICRKKAPNITSYFTVVI